MRPALLAVTFVVGATLALHLSMNAAVGKTVANPRMGNAVFWLIGAAMALVIGLSGLEGSFWAEARKVPPWLWSAGERERVSGSWTSHAGWSSPTRGASTWIPRRSRCSVERGRPRTSLPATSAASRGNWTSWSGIGRNETAGHRVSSPPGRGGRGGTRSVPPRAG